MKRLTKKDYRNRTSIIKPIGEINKIEHKLGQLEDIMEKYSIETVEDLRTRLYDCDIWKKVCELACNRMGWSIEYLLDGISREIIYPKDYANHFYQQAQKEMKK